MSQFLALILLTVVVGLLAVIGNNHITTFVFGWSCALVFAAWRFV